MRDGVTVKDAGRGLSGGVGWGWGSRGDNALTWSFLKPVISAGNNRPPLALWLPHSVLLYGTCPKRHYGWHLLPLPLPRGTNCCCSLQGTFSVASCRVWEPALASVVRLLLLLSVTRDTLGRWLLKHRKTVWWIQPFASVTSHAFLVVERIEICLYSPASLPRYEKHVFFV